MSKELTPTQVKTLATEAYSRVLKAIDDHNDAIVKSDAYVNYEKDFDHTVLGISLSKMAMIAESVDFIMRDRGFDTNSTRYSNSSIGSAVEAIKRLKTEYLERLKKKDFVLLEDSALIPKKFAPNGYRFSSCSLYNYILHKLQMAALSKNADLSAILDSIVTELITQIK
jgi:hypothetical protein